MSGLIGSLMMLLLCGFAFAWMTGLWRNRTVRRLITRAGLVLAALAFIPTMLGGALHSAQDGISQAWSHLPVAELGLDATWYLGILVGLVALTTAGWLLEGVE